MDEASHLFQFFFFDELQGIEILDFGGDLAGELGGIKLRDPGHAAFAGERFPHTSSAVLPTPQIRPIR